MQCMDAFMIFMMFRNNGVRNPLGKCVKATKSVFFMYFLTGHHIIKVCLRPGHAVYNWLLGCFFFLLNAERVCTCVYVHVGCICKGYSALRHIQRPLILQISRVTRTLWRRLESGTCHFSDHRSIHWAKLPSILCECLGRIQLFSGDFERQAQVQISLLLKSCLRLNGLFSWVDISTVFLSSLASLKCHSLIPYWSYLPWIDTSVLIMLFQRKLQSFFSISTLFSIENTLVEVDKCEAPFPRMEALGNN